MVWIRINSANIEGAGDVKFTEISKAIDEELVFIQGNVASSSLLLFEEITESDMFLNEKSQLKVNINVTVDYDGTEETKDVSFYIKCDHVSVLERFLHTT